MHHQCPNLTAAGFFNLGRNMILKVSLLRAFMAVPVLPFTYLEVKSQSHSQLLGHRLVRLVHLLHGPILSEHG